jgi:hypothetical protein
MSDWPREIGGHTVTAEMECADCGASFDCFTQFRGADCKG